MVGKGRSFEADEEALGRAGPEATVVQSRMGAVDWSARISCWMRLDEERTELVGGLDVKSENPRETFLAQAP